MANIWKCSCGQDNDGNFCINCGSTKPEGAENAVGAPAPVPAAIAPAETPAAVAPAEPETPAPAAVPVEPVKAEEPEAPATEPAPAVAPVVAPVAAAAAVDAATTDEEPVQVIKCQPMPETPMEDYSSVPADPEFAEAENVPLHDTYQPAPVAVAPVVAPVASAAPVNEPPKQVGPVNYQNTSSNPYAEPDRASHNPYAPAPVNAQPYNGGYAAAPASNSGTGLLILGIVAVVLAFDVTLGAIICGAIGCSQAKKLKLPDGSYPTGKAKVGAILSKVGLIIGIVTTIIAIIWCIVVVVGIIAGAGYALSH